MTRSSRDCELSPRTRCVNTLQAGQGLELRVCGRGGQNGNNARPSACEHFCTSILSTGGSVLFWAALFSCYLTRCRAPVKFLTLNPRICSAPQTIAYALPGRVPYGEAKSRSRRDERSKSSAGLLRLSSKEPDLVYSPVRSVHLLNVRRSTQKPGGPPQLCKVAARCLEKQGS